MHTGLLAGNALLSLAPHHRRRSPWGQQALWLWLASCWMTAQESHSLFSTGENLTGRMMKPTQEGSTKLAVI
jgi:hypothetical protein